MNKKNNQKYLAAAINEHSIYRDHHNLGSAFARAYQKAKERMQANKRSDQNDNANIE